MAKKYRVGTAPRETWWQQQRPRVKPLDHLAREPHMDAFEVFGGDLPTGGGRPSMKRRRR